MSFFEPLPDEIPVEEEKSKRVEPRVVPSWVKPSEGVLFGVVPFRDVMARTHEVCIFVDRVRADVDGLIVELELHLPEASSDDCFVDGMFPWGITPIPQERMGNPFDRYVSPTDQMRFGVLLSDGSKAESKTRQELRASRHGGAETTPRPRENTPTPAPPTITSMGSLGGGTETKSGLWIYTADYSGSVTLVVEWPVFDIDETQLTIPGDLIAIGRQEIETLW